MEIISIECYDEIEPAVIRITYTNPPSGVPMIIDLPIPLYSFIAPSLGWPTNPCDA